LPAFIYWLRSFRVPPSMVNVRYGVSAFQDEDLVEAVRDLSPERRLLTLIDSLRIWSFENEPFKGTAGDLEERLLEKDKVGRVAKLLTFPSACGTYLGRLVAQNPERISAEKKCNSSRIYTIKPPAT
jgi:hypothetical protein